MAGGCPFIWIALLLSCVFQASDNRHVRHDVNTLIGHTRDSELAQIISKIPISLPEGIDPKNINVTSVFIKSCTGTQELLTLLNRQLQQTTLRNNQLDEEAFELRREVRLLKLKHSTCSETASAITSSYQTQLRNKIKQLLETFDSDTFLILKIFAVNREVITLQKKVRLASNSTESTTKILVLQRELREKMDELNLKKEEIKRSHPNSELILQILSLQNQIWDLEQAESRRGETKLQPSKIILALQEQLDSYINELRGKGDADSAMLELISVHSKIATIQRIVSFHIEKSRTNAADYQRQWRQKIELLKRKILQLNRDESNTKLTQEILVLQSEVEHFRNLMLNAKNTTEFRLKELRVILEAEKKQLRILQKQLEETDFAQAQLFIKIINMMKEVRELQDDEQQTTSPSQETTLQTLLQTKEREYAKAQAEIKELQRKLQLKSEECSGLEEEYEQVKTELEQKIAELNRTGDPKAALVLDVIKLHDDLKALTDLISTTEDPDRIPELNKQLEDKQEELNSRNEDIKRLIANPKIVLTIIELQNTIWDLQKKPANETTSDHIEELQSRVDDLISGINDDNTKLILKIITLQSQVEQQQRQLSDLQMLGAAQVTQLRNELTTSREELQKTVNELNEKNQTNAQLIMTVTDLHSRLKSLEIERRNDNTSLTVTQLREKLKAKEGQHSRDKAEIKGLESLLQTKERETTVAQAELKELQRKLQKKSEKCSGLEEEYEQVKTELEQKIAELNRTGDSKEALVLDVINLHDDIQALKDLISTTEDPDRTTELYRQLEEKQDELYKKTADIEKLIANPRIILTVIELQNDIRDLQKNVSNENTGDHIKELQNRVDGLISNIDDKGDENIKLMLKIITLQSQVEHLQRQLSKLSMLQTAQVTQLTKELTDKRTELQKYVKELNEKNQTNAKLITTITDLQNQLRNQGKEKRDEAQTTSSTIAKLREQLEAKEEEHSHDQAVIEALQSKLNQTEAQCSDFEQKLKDLQNDLDDKINELQSKSDSITSLALQVSTLTLQIEELKRQLQNTESKTKIKELQKIIDEKNDELVKKKEELKARSGQPQRFLQIIGIQTEIEKLAYVAANDTDYMKINALQDHLTYLIDGIQDEKNENTKLMFQILARQDEIARLKKQEESQTKAQLERIKELENELEDVRNRIKEKTMVLESSDSRIANLTAQIMELHKKIKPLEDKISDLKETRVEDLEELQKRLELAKRQLQDSELRLNDADTKNFNLIMEIAGLRSQLKKARKTPSKAAEKNLNELEQQLLTQQRENKKHERTNEDLKQEVKELKMCCNDDTHCEDLQRQLQQSHDDVDRLQQELDGTDAKFTQLQLELGEKTAESNKLLDDYNNLLNENNKLEDTIQELQNKLTDEGDKTIHARKLTLDPNTAHPRVTLSAGNTEMSTSEVAQNVPDNPGRFDVVLAVLGSTGFSSGRRYWEVSVARRRCYQLGMASASARRKGTLSFSPANGYWTILRNKQGQYKAIDRRVVNIAVQTQPLTLGILLDYSKGQISFYDAGARSHMYSFVGQSFTDKIYPFIHYCLDDGEGRTPIVVVSPGSVDWIK